jgi:sugar phosphate isomerase/epimerase
MNKSMRSYVRCGLIHFMAFPNTMGGEGPIEETVRRVLVDDYFDAIEVAWIKDDATRKKVAGMLEASAITTYYGASPRLLTTGLNPNAIDEAQRAAAEKTLLEGIDEAYELGAIGYGFLSGKYEEATKDMAFDQLVKTVSNMCAYAKEKGDLKIALEVFDYNVDKASLIGPADLAKKFAETIRSKYDNFGLMVDLSHFPLIRETTRESIMPVKDYIIHAHMGNAVLPDLPKETPGYGDIHPRFDFPNGANGVEELAEYLRVLIEIGYLKEGKPATVSFEVKPFGDEDPEIVIANAKRTLNAAWELV